MLGAILAIICPRLLYPLPVPYQSIRQTDVLSRHSLAFTANCSASWVAIDTGRLCLTYAYVYYYMPFMMQSEIVASAVSPLVPSTSGDELQPPLKMHLFAFALSISHAFRAE